MLYWFLQPYRRYFDFKGRSRRREYWIFHLIWLLALFLPIIASIIAMDVAGADRAGADARSLALGSLTQQYATLLVLGSIIPMAALTVRRFHDQGKSGWFVLIYFIPFGVWALLYFMTVDGERFDNEYGPDTKAETFDSEVFS